MLRLSSTPRLIHGFYSVLFIVLLLLLYRGYATKQDIVLALEEYDLSGKQAQALLRCDNALEAIFDRWEHTEMAYMDTIRDMISCTANEKLRAAFKEKLRQGGR